MTCASRYYLRIGVADRPGVLARIAGVLSERAISIASVIQKEVDGQDTAEIVIMTHEAREADLQRALQEIRKRRRRRRRGPGAAGEVMTMSDPQNEAPRRC